MVSISCLASEWEDDPPYILLMRMTSYTLLISCGVPSCVIDSSPEAIKHDGHTVRDCGGDGGDLTEIGCCEIFAKLHLKPISFSFHFCFVFFDFFSLFSPLNVTGFCLSLLQKRAAGRLVPGSFGWPR